MREEPFARVVRDIAEVVRDARSTAIAWPPIMACLERAIGFDSGFIASTPGPTRASHGAIIGHDEAQLRANIGPYLAQLTPREVSQYLNRSRRDTEVWSTRRRQEFATFYPALSPRSARHMLVRVSVSGGQLLGINLERGACASAFRDGQLALIDAVAPLLQLVDRLDDPLVDGLDLIAVWGLTQRENDVASLVVRGLQNHEVAQILGLSAHTIRNTLVRVFEKAGATTRSELAFLAHQGRGLLAPFSAANPMGDGVLGFSQLVKRLAEAGSGALSTADSTRSSVIYSPPDWSSAQSRRKALPATISMTHR